MCLGCVGAVGSVLRLCRSGSRVCLGCVGVVGMSCRGGWLCVEVV